MRSAPTVCCLCENAYRTTHCKHCNHLPCNKCTLMLEKPLTVNTEQRRLYQEARTRTEYDTDLIADLNKSQKHERHGAIRPEKGPLEVYEREFITLAPIQDSGRRGAVASTNQARGADVETGPRKALRTKDIKGPIPGGRIEWEELYKVNVDNEVTAGAGSGVPDMQLLRTRKRNVTLIGEPTTNNNGVTFYRTK